MISKEFRPVLIGERALSINGVNGRYFGATVRRDEAPGAFCKQRWSASREIEAGVFDREKCTFAVEVRFDDELRNGHNSFAITGNIDTLRGRDVMGGCLHDEIARYFPELAPLIRWHLSSSAGPMHYIANTLHLASDTDHNGKRKGEPCAWAHGVRIGNSPVVHRMKRQFLEFIKARYAFNASTPATNPHHGEFRVMAVAYDGKNDYKFSPKYTFVGFDARWHECPFDSENEANEFATALNTSPVEFVKTATDYSAGKTREFDAARRAANWPEATDEQLSLPHEQLKALLEARLPAMLAEFRADIERIGFVWSSSDVS